MDITDEEIMAAAERSTTHNHPAAVRALLVRQRAIYTERLVEESLLVVQMKRERDDALLRAGAADVCATSLKKMAEGYRVQWGAASDRLAEAVARLRVEVARVTQGGTVG